MSNLQPGVYRQVISEEGKRKLDYKMYERFLKIFRDYRKREAEAESNLADLAFIRY